MFNWEKALRVTSLSLAGDIFLGSPVFYEDLEEVYGEREVWASLVRLLPQ